MQYNPMAGNAQPNPFAGGGNSLFGGSMPTNLDDYVKKLDEKIAELEAEEAAENAKNKENQEKKEIPQTTEAKPSANIIEDDIANILNHNMEEKKPDVEPEKAIENIFEHKANPITIDTASSPL
jgi:hypothetical protein